MTLRNNTAVGLSTPSSVIRANAVSRPFRLIRLFFLTQFPDPSRSKYRLLDERQPLDPGYVRIDLRGKVLTDALRSHALATLEVVPAKYLLHSTDWFFRGCRRY